VKFFVVLENKNIWGETIVWLFNAVKIRIKIAKIKCLWHAECK